MMTECCKYGNVKQLIMPKHKPEQFNAHSGKIYVKYDSIDEATKAVEDLAGRQYLGRICVTTYVDEAFLKQLW